MSKKILQVNLKFNALKDWDDVCDKFAQPIADVKGFLWKVFIVNEADKEAGGIYLFEDESSLKAFLEGDIVAELMKHPGISDIKPNVFDVMDKYSRITRGPID